MTLQELLDNDNQDYNRDAEPRIYARYLEYIESGHYPYIQQTAEHIAKVEGLEGVRYALEHQVYLCQQQRQKELKADRRQSMGAQGFRIAREDELVEGERYVLVRYSDGLFNTGLQPEERVRVVRNNDGRLGLMPLRNRRRGYAIGASSEFYIKPLA